MAVKKRVLGNWHDEIDLAIGVPMVRARKIFHINDVYRIAMHVGVWLDDPAVAQAAGFILAHPALLCRAFADLDNALTGLAFVGKLLEQLILQRLVARLDADQVGYRSDQA